MKKVILTSFLVLLSVFAFATPIDNAKKINDCEMNCFVPYGTITIVSETSTHYTLQVTGDPAPTLYIFVNANNTGNTTNVGGTFTVRKGRDSTLVTLAYPIGSNYGLYAGAQFP